MKATLLTSIALGISTALAAPFTPDNPVSDTGISDFMGDLSKPDAHLGNHAIKREERTGNGIDALAKDDKAGYVFNKRSIPATKREGEAPDVHNTFLKEDIASGDNQGEAAAASRVNDASKREESAVDLAMTRMGQDAGSAFKRDGNVPAIGLSEKAEQISKRQEEDDDDVGGGEHGHRSGERS